MTKQPLTKEEMKQLQELAEHNRERVRAVGGEINEAEGVITLPYEEYAIYDMFYDETLRFEVDPVTYYGYDVIQEALRKWNQAK